MVVAEDIAPLQPELDPCVPRRLVAFIIDYLIFGLVLTVLLASLINLWPKSQPYLPGPFFKYNSCHLAGKNLDVSRMLERLHPEPGEEVSNVVCETTGLFLPSISTGTLAATKVTHSGSTTWTSSHSLSYRINADGSVEDPGLNLGSGAGTISVILLILVFATLLALWGSPGKRVMSIRVVPKGWTPQQSYTHPAFALSLKREALKQLPNLFFNLAFLSFGAVLVMTTDTAKLADPLWVPMLIGMGIIGALTLALFVYWYIMPLASWKGAMRHDQLLGLEVVKLA